ncbi:GNAT family N-acetyltransferase [Arthrobacter castelli]|uniref:GNAT family N-acetyltransferase n=1 Tax=Arthrobacter castelli TaxID=271431 RepID=UPI000413B32E|nr:GNAT family N-acetyltransferase [Arthrobacter castelli]
MNFPLRPVDPDADARLLHSWFSQDYASFWDMLDAGVDDVRREHRAIAASDHHHALLGFDGGAPVFLMERYDPARSPIAGCYEATAADVGMHLLVAPPAAPVPGYTRSVMAAVLDHLFEDPTVERVVVEPDIRNHKIQALNDAAGFRPVTNIELPDKTAVLSICTRTDYAAARNQLARRSQEATA